MGDRAAKPEQELDVSRLPNGLWGISFGLVVSSWVGLAFGIVLVLIFLLFTNWLLLIGVMAKLYQIVIYGGVAVPAFGLLLGHWSVSRAKGAAIRAVGGRQLEPDHVLVKATAHIADRMGVPCPTVAIYPSDEINAFATGRPGKSAVCLAQGLLNAMTPPAVIGVIAHEVAHIANRDSTRMGIAMSFQRSLTWYLRWWHRGETMMRWIFSTLGEIMLMRLSRKREYWADATAAAVVGKDKMLAALRQLEGDDPNADNSNPALAAFKIRNRLKRIFYTHPPTELRIHALEQDWYTSQLPMRPVGVAKATSAGQALAGSAQLSLTPDAPQASKLPEGVSSRAAELAP